MSSLVERVKAYCTCISRVVAARAAWPEACVSIPRDQTFLTFCGDQVLLGTTPPHGDLEPGGRGFHNIQSLTLLENAATLKDNDVVLPASGEAYCRPASWLSEVSGV